MTAAEAPSAPSGDRPMKCLPEKKSKVLALILAAFAAGTAWPAAAAEPSDAGAQNLQTSDGDENHQAAAKPIVPENDAPEILNEPLGAGLQAAPDAGKLQKAEGTGVIPKSREDRRYLEGFSQSPELDAELIDISDALQTFRSEAANFSKDIQSLIQKKFDERKKGIEEDYDRKVSDLENQERKARLESIAAFEAFVQRYPNDPGFTPDALFRLAELYYEKTSDEEQEASRRFDEQTELAQQGLAPFPAEPPKFSYQPSISIYQRLINDFPDYAHNDASLYLLGYCQSQQGEYPESRDSFNRLITRYPASRFVPEAWIRIGEYYFDAVNEPDALRKAAAAYTKAVEFDKHPLFDKALYKLGWTYYRVDDFGRAVNTFVRLLDYYESASKDSGDQGGDLKSEALQYIAISFAEDSWGSIERAEKLFEDIGDRPWKAELWRLIGNAYADQTKGEEAIEAYRRNLKAAPLAPNAPQVHSKIVDIYERTLRETQKAFQEREILTAAYAPGTPWYEANKNDSKALKAAEELAEKGLYNAAVHFHQQAAKYASQPEKADRAKETFAAAAKLYTAYLERFPHSLDVYQVTFYLADCLYNSLNFEKAITAYERVRDFHGESQHKTEAAFGVVMSRQNALDLTAGKPDSDIPKVSAVMSSKWPSGKPVEKRPLHPVYEAYVKAIDIFVSLAPNDEIAPQAAYNAAEIYYAHEDFPEARKRFAAIVAAWPDNTFASYASNMTLETFLITEDWLSVIEFTNSLTTPDESGAVRIDPASKEGKRLRDFGDNAMFKRAEQLMAANEWLEAGELFEKLVARNEKYPYADLALNNAALCQEKSNRFESALRIYERLYKEYPSSSRAPKALFRVALNAERSYDFDKAVKSYALLADRYKDAVDQRKAAIHNMAILLDGLQRYEESAAQFSRYAQAYPDDAFAAPDLYRAAGIYRKMGNCRRHNQAMEAFIARFGKDKAQDGFVVQAYKSIGDCWKTMGNEKRAFASYEMAAKEYLKRHLDGSYSSASDAAGEAKFLLAEEKFKKWDSIEIKGSMKSIEKAFNAKLTSAGEVSTAYNDVLQFKSAKWILAAFYRKGYIFDRFAASITDAECPMEVIRFGGQDACDEYRLALVERTTAQQTMAASLYEQTVAQCLRMGVVDVSWCDLAEESMARIRETAVLKKVRPAFISSTPYPGDLMTLSGENASKALKQKAAEEAAAREALQAKQAELEAAEAAKKLQEQEEQKENGSGTSQQQEEAADSGNQTASKPVSSPEAADSANADAQTEAAQGSAAENQQKNSTAEVQNAPKASSLPSKLEEDDEFLKPEEQTEAGKPDAQPAPDSGKQSEAAKPTTEGGDSTQDAKKPGGAILDEEEF